jgi:hypothetical protein
MWMGKKFGVTAWACKSTQAHNTSEKQSPKCFKCLC